MSNQFKREVEIRNIVSIDSEKAKALEDPIRVAILDILSRQSCSIMEIVEKLKEHGIVKAPTTIRHHVDILKKAGLIELTELRETKGGILKYYASNTLFIHQTMPDNFDEALSPAIEFTKKSLERVIQEVKDRYWDQIVETAENLKACPYCSTEHFIDHITVNILNRALVDILRKSG
jgi:DNA-binding transcriptional ArsR family regulator